MDESSTNQSQLWRDSIDENTIAENEATDEIIDDMKDPSPVRKGRRSSPTKKEIIQKHMTPGGVVSSYKTVAACEDELERGRLQEKIEKAQLDVMAKRKVALEARDLVIENEMRTIMSDHSSFGDILKDLGKSGYGDTRHYGDYK